jgi:hypothetical protein
MFGGEYEKTEIEFKPIPKGRYLCKLDNCCIEQTPDKADRAGTKYLKMDFTILTGPSANRKIWHKLWFSEKAYNMAAQQLDNMGVFNDIKPTATLDEFLMASAEAAFTLVGKKLEVSVTGHQTFNDKTYENTFVTGHGDVEKVIAKAAVGAGVNTSEEIPF